MLIFKPLRKVGRSEKLLHRWLGPYLVLRQTTPVNYEVILRDGRQKSDIVHVARMKPFFELEAPGAAETDQPVILDPPNEADEENPSTSERKAMNSPETPPPHIEMDQTLPPSPISVQSKRTRCNEL